ncbi:Wzz/FepE/Etk N-terminal domain-containing protein [Salinibacter sp.]|uniref:Wzz/FepE/Etk N-terminal domain-containing protein n=1 Tax=Salinibacter sp. TaxID=2065818 RepID=UPI0021E6FD9F|nr:Wzz/FepE/Etk N-terminal domain-containing protein [Salinibacter sp.]
MSAKSQKGHTGNGDDPPPGDGVPPAEHPGRGRTREDEVSVLDILLVIARNRAIILGCMVVFGGIAGLYTLSMSETYTAEATVIREGQSASDQVGGQSAALRGLGFDVGGGGGGGLGPGSYPAILNTREVRLAVARDTFSYPDVEEPMTYVDYVNRPTEPSWPDVLLDYTLWLPWTLRDALREMEPVEVDEKSIYPTPEEERAMRAVGGKVETSNEGGFMVISATTDGPEFSAELTKSFIRHLTDRVQDLRTERTQRNLEFVEQKYQEAKRKLEAAEDRLASFLDRNQNIRSAELRNQRDRLQRQVQHQLELYNDWQGQLTQAEIELQRSEPVVTTVEAPVPPSDPDSSRPQLFLIVGLLFGLFLGMAGAFVKAFLRYATDESDEEVQAKVEELKRAFVPGKVRERFGGARKAE